MKSVWNRNLKNMIFTKNNLVLFGIFLLALFLRTYQLRTLPHAFYNEEVTNAYVGRFILLNGKDLYGNAWPLLYFDKFGDYPPVLPMYLSGIGTFIFGVNEFGARFPIALFGALGVFPMYFLSKLVFEDSKMGWFSSFLLAVLPWHVVLSRTTAEGVVGFTIFSLALYFMLKGLQVSSKSFVFTSAALLFLCYFLYPGLRIIIPLALLPTPFLYRRIGMKGKLLAVGLIAFFFILTLSISSTQWGRGRFLQTSLFHSPEVASRISAHLQALSNDEGSNNILIARIFHNKVTGYFREAIEQYLSYFSVKFLFLEGGIGQYRYYNVPNQGLLYISLIPLFFISILMTRKKNINTQVFNYFIYMLVITPITAAVTVDFVPHAHRSMFMIIPFILLATYGFYTIWGIRFKSVSIAFLFFPLLLFEFIYFWHQYSAHSASLQSVLRNDGDRELVLRLKEERNKYSRVIMPVFERLPIYYLYFTNNFDPSLAGKFRTELRIDSVDNIEFFRDWCPSKLIKADSLSPKTLVVDNGDCEGRRGYNDIALTMRKDSTRAYRFLIPAL